MLAFIICLAGFAALAFSQPKHARELLGHRNTANKRRICRVSGWALLAVSLTACLIAWDGTTGWVAWFGLASAATFIVALALTYAPPGVLSPRAN